MELISFKDYPKLAKTKLVAAIGEFDCLHLAHQELLNRTILLSKKYNLKSAIITFDPHPFEIILDKKIQICSLQDKINYFKNYDLDYLIVINFDKELVKLDPDSFVKEYLLTLNLKYAVVGFDFSFGYKGLGKPLDIKKYSNNLIDVDIIDELQIDNRKIGSTLIREKLLEGNIDYIDKLLNHKLSLIAKVIKGHGLGHKIGIPTANLEFLGHLELKEGVYAVSVTIDGKDYKGMLNVGHNKSFNEYSDLSYEVHIIDYIGDLYNQYLTITLYSYVREEINFNSIEDFKKQIKIDKNKINLILLDKKLKK